MLRMRALHARWEGRDCESSTSPHAKSAAFMARGDGVAAPPKSEARSDRVSLLMAPAAIQALFTLPNSVIYLEDHGLNDSCSPECVHTGQHRTQSKEARNEGPNLRDCNASFQNQNSRWTRNMLNELHSGATT